MFSVWAIVNGSALGEVSQSYYGMLQYSEENIRFKEVADMSVMISLIGEQAAPNLLPVRQLQPEKTVQVYTERTETVAQRLKPLLEHPSSGHTPTEVYELPVSPFDMVSVQRDLRDSIEKNHWSNSELIFNLTGGTKLMAYAAQQLAYQLRSDFVYLQSQGGKNLLHRYTFSSWGELQQIGDKPVELPPLLNLDEYLRAYLGKYAEHKPKNDSEAKIAKIIKPRVDEYKTSVKKGDALEIDAVLRCGNQIGVIEIKAGKANKQGIDQITTAAEQRFLGTYIRKFYIVAQPLVKALQDLARAHRIQVIELLSLDVNGNLSEADQTYMTEIITNAMGCKSRSI